MTTFNVRNAANLEEAELLIMKRLNFLDDGSGLREVFRHIAINDLSLAKTMISEEPDATAEIFHIAAQIVFLSFVVEEAKRRSERVRTERIAS